MPKHVRSRKAAAGGREAGLLDQRDVRQGTTPGIRHAEQLQRRRHVRTGAYVALGLIVLWALHAANKYSYMYRERTAPGPGGVRSSEVTEAALDRPCTGADQRVPKIVHHMWKDPPPVPQKWKLSYGSWEQRAPESAGWSHMYWTDEKGYDLVALKFPWFLKTYEAYPHNIQRIDALRLFVLYVDADSARPQ